MFIEALRNPFVPFLLTTLNAAIRAAFNPATLFAAGEQGAWYDESDMSTLYQDSAGTTPVTAVEQFIGRMLDKSGRNNHVTQAVAGSRLVVSARVNLLTYSEDFTNAVWTVQGITKTSNTITVIATGANKELGEGFTSVAGANYSLMFEVGSGTATACKVALSDRTANANGRYFNLAAGTISASTNLAAGTNCLVVGSSIALNPSTGRYICTVVFTTLNATTYYATVGIVDAVGTDTATAGKSITATFAQLDIGSTSNRYQRVNTSADYDTINFPAYAKLDGVDDSMTSATGGAGTAGFFFCQAIKPTGGAGTVRTLLSDSGTNSGYRVQLNASNQLSISAGNGTAYTTVATATATTIGTTHLLTAWDDGTNLNVQLDSGTVATIARPVVTAGTAGLTIGKDNGAATGFFAGNMYPEVYRQGSGLTAAERASVQQYVKSKAGL